METGPKASTSWMAVGASGRAAEEDDRVEEGALLGVAGGEGHAVGVAGDDLGLPGELADALADFLALVEAGEGAHAGRLVGRVAEGGLREAVAEGGDEGVGEGARGDDAADGGALLARLHRHLAGDLACTKRSNSGVPGPASGPRIAALRLSASMVKRVEFSTIAGCELQLAAGPGGAGEGDDVLAGDVVEEVADGAGDELQRAGGQDAGVDDPAHGELGQVGGLARGLHDAGHAGDQRRRDLLQHAPDREVEGVDVDGDAFERGQDVLGGEAAVLRQELDVAVGEDAGVRELAAGLGGVGEQRADAALDVDPAVGAGGAGGEALGVELFL